MKRIMVCCGAGVATSTVVRSKIAAWLSQQQLADCVTLTQGSIAELQQHHDVDIVVSSSALTIGLPVINALPLLTGVGAENIFAQLRALILARGDDDGDN